MVVKRGHVGASIPVDNELSSLRGLSHRGPGPGLEYTEPKTPVSLINLNTAYLSQAQFVDPCLGPLGKVVFSMVHVNSDTVHIKCEN